MCFIFISQPPSGPKAAYRVALGENKKGSPVGKPSLKYVSYIHISTAYLLVIGDDDVCE